MRSSALATLLALGTAHAAYTATYRYDDPAHPNLPDKTEEGQFGTNNCAVGTSSQDSMCQNLFLNSVTDFCLFGPDKPNSAIGDIERETVAWCLRAGYGTRLFPDGTITGAHWVQTDEYVQITGWGDFTKIGVKKGDAGGELDPHGADQKGNPIGGLVFGSSYGGGYFQYHEWTNFMSATEFCIKACRPGPNARKQCQHIYDLMGCKWNVPGNYDEGVFESCKGDVIEPMGIYGNSTFRQGQPNTPAAHDAAASSDCTTVQSVTSYSAALTVDIKTTYTVVSQSGGGARTVPVEALQASSTGLAKETGKSSGVVAKGMSGGAVVGAAVLGVGMMLGAVIVL